MTARQVWEGMLTELSKVNAPSMLLQDFNYFFNKAINQYINKRYNIYDINQQTTDDLRVLKATSILGVSKATTKAPMNSIINYGAGKSKLLGATYEVDLPDDYLHILNCVCIYKVNKDWKCYNQGDYVQFSAKRLTADSWSVILNDYYNRPLPERPYFYVHNVNVKNELSTNPYETDNLNGTDIGYESSNGRDAYNVDPEIIKSTTTTCFYKSTDGSNKTPLYRNPNDGKYYTDKTFESVTTVTPEEEKLLKVVTTITNTPSENSSILNSNFKRTIKVNGHEVSSVQRHTAVRYGNSSKVRMEIRYGHDDSIFQLEKVFVDYIKSPQHIRLTQEQVNLTEDTSLIMEFPDYVCQEIINELTNIVMENTADPRLQTHPVVTKSIDDSAHQLTHQPQQPRVSQTKRG